MKIIIFLIQILSFQFANADYSVVAVGDTGKGNDQQLQVGKALARECRNIQCQFALLLGDNIYDSGLSSASDQQMAEKFEKPYAEMPAPFYVTLGNHDYGKLANEWIKGDYQIQYSKTNPNYILPSYYYSFEQEDTLFLVLDTSRLFHDKDTDQQVQFVRKALAQNNKKWVVAVGHHPYLSNGQHGNAGKYDGVPFPPYSGSVIKKFIENELCGKIDIYIGGHDHNLQTLPGVGACSKVLFVVSGTGASESQKLAGKNTAYFQSASLGFSSLKFSKNKITVSHYNINGNILHAYDYTKPKSFFNVGTWFE